MYHIAAKELEEYCFEDDKKQSKNRKSSTVEVQNLHAALVNDFNYSPFSSCILFPLAKLLKLNFSPIWLTPYFDNP